MYLYRKALLFQCSGVVDELYFGKLDNCQINVIHIIKNKIKKEHLQLCGCSLSLNIILRFILQFHLSQRKVIWCGQSLNPDLMEGIDFSDRKVSHLSMHPLL